MPASINLDLKNRFAGQVALVTGGAGGIGAAVANALSSLGAQVVSADVRKPAALASSVEAVTLDVTDGKAVCATVQAIAARYKKLDILVNAAGVVSFGAAANLSEGEWDRVIDINLKGTFLCCQSSAAVMRSAKYGRIINFGSVVGKNGGNARPWIDANEQQGAANVAYGVSKAGVHAMTAFLAKELAGVGITVNAVAPGPISTDMTTSFPAGLRAAIPAGRMGTMEDVVHAVMFLADKRAGFVTGEVLDVNGGIWCD